ncbi:unnamed protein product [Amoebophrya sp. A120]|nr:unnamed protein product [Amoebophrya sp. A120]|eukprot:GSA120T00004791001.1
MVDILCNNSAAPADVVNLASDDQNRVSASTAGASGTIIPRLLPSLAAGRSTSKESKSTVNSAVELSVAAASGGLTGALVAATHVEASPGPPRDDVSGGSSGGAAKGSRNFADLGALHSPVPSGTEAMSSPGAAVVPPALLDQANAEDQDHAHDHTTTEGGTTSGRALKHDSTPEQEQDDAMREVRDTTIIFTIHQPSSLLYSCFSSVYFLGQGECAYFGPADQLGSWLSRAGFHSPPFYSAAEFALDTIQDTEKLARLVQKQQQVDEKKKLQILRSITSITKSNGTTNDEQHDAEHISADRDDERESGSDADRYTPSRSSGARSPGEMEELQGRTPVSDEETKQAHVSIKGRHKKAKSSARSSKSRNSVANLLASRKRAPWWVEFSEIWKRTLIARLRQRYATKLAIIQNTFVTILIGIFFFDVGKHPSKVDTRNGAMFFILTHPLFSATFEAMLPLVMSGMVLQREFQTKRLYRLSSFFAARTTGELPIIMIFPLIYTIGAWSLMQFHPEVVLNLELLGISLICQLAGQSLGYFIGSLTQDVEVAISLGIVVLVPLFLLNPFILDASLIPVSIAWVRHCSQFYYGFLAFGSWTWEGLEMESCSAQEQLEFPKNCSLYRSGDLVLHHRFGITVADNPHLKRNALLCLLLLTVITRLLAFFRFYVRYEYADNWLMALHLSDPLAENTTTPAVPAKGRRSSLEALVKIFRWGSAP